MSDCCRYLVEVFELEESLSGGNDYSQQRRARAVCHVG